MSSRKGLPIRSKSGRRRGFTLVEVLIAVTAGLMVSAAAFVLARNATTFFQHEARISSAQLSALMGMERIVADLDRAAFLSTSNIHSTPKRCPKGVGLPSLPAGLEQLAGIQLEAGGSINGANALPQSVANGMSPDRITIGGSFDNNDALEIAAILPGANGGATIQLDTSRHQFKRAVAAGQDLAKTFRAGRILRIVDPYRDDQYYAVIAGFDKLNNTIQVGFSALMPYMPSQSTCGIGLGVNQGWLVNPVSRVRYEIRSLAGHPTYKNVVAAISSDASGDAGRSELTRVELDATGAEIPDTLELIAEYAVDLKFGLTIFIKDMVPPEELAGCSTTPGTGLYSCPIPMTPQAYAGFAGPVKGGSMPELIRSVQVRLATRARAPDRDADLTGGPDGRKYRFKLNLPGAAVPQFARLRTLYAEKYLRNQELL